MGQESVSLGVVEQRRVYQSDLRRISAECYLEVRVLGYFVDASVLRGQRVRNRWFMNSVLCLVVGWLSHWLAVRWGVARPWRYFLVLLSGWFGVVTMYVGWWYQQAGQSLDRVNHCMEHYERMMKVCVEKLAELNVCLFDAQASERVISELQTAQCQMSTLFPFTVDEGQQWAKAREELKMDRSCETLN